MNDKTLLTLAAKAAGIQGEIKDHGGEFWIMNRADHGDAWNPLASDADALRLAVKLDMVIEIHNKAGVTTVYIDYEDYDKAASEKHGTDPYAATRRAIVRAAAAIGEGME